MIDKFLLLRTPFRTLMKYQRFWKYKGVECYSFTPLEQYYGAKRTLSF